MDSSNHHDMLSSLTDVLLIIIITYLPFKEAVRTSVLSRRWRKLCHETRNISFKEAEYVDHSASDDVSRTNSFFRYVDKWVSRFKGDSIESFELCLSNPEGYVAKIESLIEFVSLRKVKNLVLDFANPTWSSYFDAYWFSFPIELPSCFYDLSTTLESLKISACMFDPSRLGAMDLLKRFSVGFIALPSGLEDLISNTLQLESLVITYCWDLDIPSIAGDMREVVIEKCGIDSIESVFYLPKVDIFKYYGIILPFFFEKMGEDMKEVYLDFGMDEEYDIRTQLTNVEGNTLTSFLNRFQTAKTLNVCPYLLQVIQESSSTHPFYLLRPIQTQHLILRTKLHTKEFKGIKLMLDNCPNLETLTLDIISPIPFPGAWTYDGIDPLTYWYQDVLYEKFPKRLKVVVVRNFGGSIDEINVLQFLIRAVHGPAPMLERIELYMAGTMNECQRVMAQGGVVILQEISEPVQVIIHNA